VDGFCVGCSLLWNAGRTLHSPHGWRYRLTPVLRSGQSRLIHARRWSLVLKTLLRRRCHLISLSHTLHCYNYNTMYVVVVVVVVVAFVVVVVVVVVVDKHGLGDVAVWYHWASHYTTATTAWHRVVVVLLVVVIVVVVVIIVLAVASAFTLVSM